MNINLQNTNGSTILYALLDFYYRDDIQEYDDDENNPDHHHAAVQYHDHLRTHIRPYAEYLLQRGADPLLHNKRGETPLTFVESLTRCPLQEKEALLALLQTYA